MTLSTSVIFGFAALSHCVTGAWFSSSNKFDLDNTEFISKDDSNSVYGYKVPNDAPGEQAEIKMTKKKLTFKGYGENVSLKWDDFLELEIKKDPQKYQFVLRGIIPHKVRNRLVRIKFSLDTINKKHQSIADKFEECYRSFRKKEQHAWTPSWFDKAIFGNQLQKCYDVENVKAYTPSGGFDSFPKAKFYVDYADHTLELRRIDGTTIMPLDVKSVQWFHDLLGVDHESKMEFSLKGFQTNIMGKMAPLLLQLRTPHWDGILKVAELCRTQRNANFDLFLEEYAAAFINAEEILKDAPAEIAKPTDVKEEKRDYVEDPPMDHPTPNVLTAATSHDDRTRSVIPRLEKGSPAANKGGMLRISHGNFAKPVQYDVPVRHVDDDTCSTSTEASSSSSSDMPGTTRRSPHQTNNTNGMPGTTGPPPHQTNNTIGMTTNNTDGMPGSILPNSRTTRGGLPVPPPQLNLEAGAVRTVLVVDEHGNLVEASDI